MYVPGARSASFLGSYILPRKPRRRGLSGLGYRPNQAVQRIYTQKKPNMTGTRGLRGTFRGMGQDADGYGDISDLTNSAYNITPDTSSDSSFIDVDANPLTSFTADATSSSLLSPTAAFAAMQASATPMDAGDYVSPAAALAAGVPAAQVSSVWATAQGVNSFPSQSAATAALTATMGAASAAATVAKLWTGGGAAPPTSASSGFLSQSTAGIPNAVLLGGGALILLIGMMGGGKR